eukprot:CAMPEP_0172169088 /NCGR_PEP_ID=MMETSP1050-20130122/10508_1 /TAXON_ID=233186 /ORGANISM="Cryptomonas curvata, Strain CCAP979/52" /LENGTH=82 /DNA_ID=CAMNT_0012840101 /DNA_START=342 /DNA_END=590 /DNA_ORIENTATION=+
MGYVVVARWLDDATECAEAQLSLDVMESAVVGALLEVVTGDVEAREPTALTSNEELLDLKKYGRDQRKLQQAVQWGEPPNNV